MPRNPMEYGNDEEEVYTIQDNAHELGKRAAEGRLDDAGTREILLEEMNKHREGLQERIEHQWAEKGREGFPVIAEHEVARAAWNAMWPLILQGGYDQQALDYTAAARHRVTMEIMHEGTDISEELLNQYKGIPKEEEPPKSGGIIQRMRSFTNR